MAEQLQDQGQVDLQSMLKRCVQTSLNRNLLAKGLHEVTKAIENVKRPKFCLLAGNCSEESYKKLIEQLCKQNNVPMIEIPEAETLGEWIGICKYDLQKQIRKKRKCSCLAVRDFAIEIGEDEKKAITDHLNDK